MARSSFDCQNVTWKALRKKKVAVNFSFPNVDNLCMYVYFLTTPLLGGGSFQGQHEQTGEKHCE